MQREPNPYAQSPAYTVTQIMAISAPSVVVEDVLDGEDMGGGGSSIDSSTLVALQSDMVELKSDVTTLETNVSNLTQNTIPAINASAATAQQKADSAYNLASQKSQVTWLTTPDYKTSKLQITSGSGLKALQLTTEGQTATVYDLVVRETGSDSGDGVAGYLISKNDSDSAIVALTIASAPAHVTWGIANPSNSNAYIVSGIKLLTTNAIGTYSHVGSTTSVDSLNGSIVPKYANGQLSWCYSDDGGGSWTDLSKESSSDVTLSHSLKKLNFSGDWDYKAIFISGSFNGETGLYYYALAAEAFVNAEYPAYQLKAGKNGILYTTNGGTTWTTVSGGGAGSGSTSNTVTFGPFGASDQYELSLALGQTDTYSAIVELRDTTNDYSGAAALGAYLTSPNSNAYIDGVLMAVSGMGTLVFKHHDETVTYDLNNLGGTGSGESSTSSALATYINNNANSPISSYDVAGDLKVLRGSGRKDDTSGVVTLYLDDDNNNYISGVNVLLNAALTAGRKVNNDRYLYGGIRPVISEDEQTLSWEYRRLDRSGGWTPVATDVDTTEYKLAGYIDSTNNVITDLDYQLCLGRDSSSDLPYIIVTGTNGNSWTPLIYASDRPYLDALGPITHLINAQDALFQGSSEMTYRLIGATNGAVSTSRYLEFSDTIADQLNTTAGSLSLSNMVWLSANASKLAALLNS